MLIFWLNAVADKSVYIDYAVSFSLSLENTNHVKKACVELWGSKKVTFRGTK
jgi:hypothetical protein